jgi:hypothetical protein
MKRWIRLPSPAMMVALAALVMSTGGTVTAAALITSADIKNNTIRSVDVRNGSLSGADIKDSTVSGADVRNNTLTGADLANNSVHSAEVVDGSLTGADLASNSVHSAKVADGSLTGADLASNSVHSAKVVDGSLTGADIDESTLGQVPSAANATEAQNSGTVDGFEANALTRVALMATSVGVTIVDSHQTYGDALSITAPAAGFVMIHGGTQVVNFGGACTTGCYAFGFVRHLQSGARSSTASAGIGAAGSATMSHAWVFPVEAGVNTFDLRLLRSTGNGFVNALSAELAAIYSPFGPTGTGTLAADITTTGSPEQD